MIRQVRSIHTAREALACGRDLEISTVGHSTRSAAGFLELLRAHGIRQIVDVRRFPASRRFPHFARGVLGRFLRNHRIGYRHMEVLGGRRRSSPDSPNIAWRNVAFRGFADYMQTDDFQIALDRLIEIARTRRTAILCAEALPWRCHRWLISDAISARGIVVSHIISPSAPRRHTLSPMAVRAGRYLTYPMPAK